MYNKLPLPCDDEEDLLDSVPECTETYYFIDIFIN